ncbi:peptidoglycan L-alanyl-D-glutamate endopeptidase CwlK [Paenibacillaceae bacterium GAS479]|nr:peptidoglycan L-alanyl-D-glutamate endopeptidase CwlK [Paenibacillaceae bacterium GAS479]
MGMPQPARRTRPASAATTTVRAKARRKQRRLGWFILVLGFIATAGALIKLELPRVFDKAIPQGLYREVPAVSALHPEVSTAAKELTRKAKAAGITVVYTDDFRSSEAQDKLYEKGRSQGGSVVTHAKGGESYHNYGLAIDFALKDKRGEIIWDMEYDGNRNGKADWLEVASLGKGLGFTWGGDWPDFKDNPHLQMDFGYSIWELQKGNRPPGSLLADGTTAGGK